MNSTIRSISPQTKGRPCTSISPPAFLNIKTVEIKKMYNFFNHWHLIKITKKKKELQFFSYSGSRGFWTVNNTGTKSFKNTFSNIP